MEPKYHKEIEEKMIRFAYTMQIQLPYIQNNNDIPIIEKELWTSKQKQCNPIHEISYRACFKAQLPNYFIQKYTKEGDIVYDPFSGRGTTGIEASLNGRIAYFNDINPLSRIMAEPRLNLVDIEIISKRFDEILSNNNIPANTEIDLSMFFHIKTFEEIVKIKQYLIDKEKQNKLDAVDKWIRLLVLNRLTGHSSGFLSTFTLPPNQAVSPERQLLINQKYNNKIEYKNVKKCCLKKYKALTSDIDIFTQKKLDFVKEKALFLTKDAEKTPEIKDNSVDLIITSPPFLDVINYKQDNWMRCWFCNIDIDSVNISCFKKLQDWEDKMYNVLLELKRILKTNGHIAFEVGEVKNGKIKLEQSIVNMANKIGFSNIKVFINKQSFTKTSNIWGITNNKKGTNSNRIVFITK